MLRLAALGADDGANDVSCVRVKKTFLRLPVPPAAPRTTASQMQDGSPVADGGQEAREAPAEGHEGGSPGSCHGE